VTTCWADERVYYPLHAVPYTPAHHFPHGKSDPGFRTKLQIGAVLARQATEAGVSFRAVAADCAYGDHDSFRRELSATRLPFVMALKRSHGTWQYKDAFRPVDAARELAWRGPEQPGDWQPVTRAFRDGRTTTWWAADAQLGWWGPNGAIRLVVATTDPATLPENATWYLATNLPRPGSPREQHSRHPAAGITEIVRIYGLRHWVEQSYKQVKDELGWADFQVRSDTGIRRHQTLVNCAFSFCWNTWFAPPPPLQAAPLPGPDALPDPSERGRTDIPAAPAGLLAPSHPGRPWLADALGHAATLLAGMVDEAPARSTPGTDQHRRQRQTS
uniref:IS701 family transposase n=1 Tax=Streptomyces sp. Tue6028 TaxID=2036037 RepID=UPI003D73B0F6